MDLGSNMFRMIVNRYEKGAWQTIRSFSWVISIGNHNGHIDTRAINRICISLDKAKDILSGYKDVKIFCVATAAMRSASNANDIIKIIMDKYGIVCRVIDPGTEVMLSGTGCRDVFLDGLSLFIDMGGGSTEVGLFRKTLHSLHLVSWISMPYGLFYCSKFSQNSKLDWIPRHAKSMIQNFVNSFNKFTHRNLPLVICRSGIVSFVTAYMARTESMPKSAFHGKIIDRSHFIKILDGMINMNDVDIMRYKMTNRISCISSLRGSLIFTRQIISLLPIDFVVMGNGGVKEGMLLMLMP